MAREKLQQAVRTALSSVLETEVDTFIGAVRYEHGEQRRDYRNGHYPPHCVLRVALSSKWCNSVVEGVYFLLSVGIGGRCSVQMIGGDGEKSIMRIQSNITNLVNDVKSGSGTDVVIRFLPTDEEVSGNRFGSG